MRTTFSRLIVLTVCACTLVAQGGPAFGRTANGQGRHRQYRYTSYRLANGLRVVLAPDETQSGVAVNLSFDAGSGVEDAGQAGLAGLAQRIVLQNLRRSQDGERGDAGGGRPKPFEGVVNQERASYLSECTAGRLDSVVSSQARRTHAPEVTRTSVDEQTLVMLDECRQSDNRRFGRVQEVLLELLYQDSAHRYGAVCSAPDLNHLTPERTEAFLKTYYVPANAVVAIVGNFDEADARRIVAKHFGAVRGRKAPSRARLRDRPPSLGRRKVIDDARAAAATYMSAYPTVPSNHPDWYAMNVLADVIGQGETSRLHAALVTKSLAASVPEGVAESRGRSLFRVGAALLPGVRVETVEAVIDAEIARLRDEGVTRTELEKAKAQERAYYSEQLGTPAGRASFLARSTLYYDEPNLINTELGFILAVTSRDVRRVARKYLVRTNRAVVISRPGATK
ncbi:MAG TPA: pitrilysin family protein [Pyrinomonadaceae bacterium]|jgi:predicted Zn-dependent peptidase